jgi:hypothetical protein
MTHSAVVIYGLPLTAAVTQLSSASKRNYTERRRVPLTFTHEQLRAGFETCDTTPERQKFNDYRLAISAVITRNTTVCTAQAVFT